MAALTFPAANLDDIICGTGNEVIQDGGRKRKGRHFTPPARWGRKGRPILLNILWDIWIISEWITVFYYLNSLTCLCNDFPISTTSARFTIGWWMQTIYPWKQPWTFDYVKKLYVKYRHDFRASFLYSSSNGHSCICLHVRKVYFQLKVKTCTQRIIAHISTTTTIAQHNFCDVTPSCELPLDERGSKTHSPNGCWLRTGLRDQRVKQKRTHSQMKITTLLSYSLAYGNIVKLAMMVGQTKHIIRRHISEAKFTYIYQSLIIYKSQLYNSTIPKY